METLHNMPTATPESVWAMFQESAKRHEDINRMLQELAQSQKETDRIVQDTARQVKEVSQTVGGMGNSQGAFAEEYFFNSFEKGQQNFFGEKFDEISKQLKSRKQELEDEYDIVLYNHSSIAIIEVKYKARASDIPKVLKKAETFKILYPYYQDFKIYLGLASMSFSPEIEEACIQHGIVIIKQVGETVVIRDEHLKVF